MIFDLLAAEPNLVGDILDTAADTSGARQAVQISLAPVFLLVAIGGVMNVVMTRLIWIAGRIERLEENKTSDNAKSYDKELLWLRTRRLRARRAIMFSTAAGVCVSILVAILFVATFFGVEVGLLVASLWVIAMGLLLSLIHI